MKRRINPRWIVILAVLPIAVAILIRTLSADRFGHNARKLAGPSFDRSNLVTWQQLPGLAKDYLVLDLDGSGDLGDSIPGGRVVSLPAGRVLDAGERDLLRNQGKPVLLFSSDPAVSARVWMLLTQMGYRNLFILSGETGPEVFRYRFEPDEAQSGTHL